MKFSSTMPNHFRVVLECGMSPRKSRGTSEATGLTCLEPTTDQSHTSSPPYQQPYREPVSKSMCCRPGQPPISHCIYPVPWRRDETPGGQRRVGRSHQMAGRGMDGWRLEHGPSPYQMRIRIAGTVGKDKASISTPV